MSETIKVIADVTSGEGLIFYCVTCRTQLDYDWEKPTELQHPTHDGSAMFGKGKQVDCPFVGKKFAHPFVVDLKELASP